MAFIQKRPGRPLPYFVYWREPGSKVQRSKAFARRKDAEGYRDTVSTDLRRGTYTDPRPIAFKAFAADWLARTKPTVSASTHALHEWAVSTYLVPAFNLTPIQNLTAEKIERWQADLLGRGKPGPRSVEICRTVLGTVLKDARQKGRLYINPMEMVRRFEVPKRELHYLTPEQVKALCEQVGRFYGILFLVMAFCGLRIGETLGLQWSDVNLSRRRLFIQRQAIWLRKKDCPEGEPRWRLVEPKSEAGERVVEIPGPLVRFLAAHREEQKGTPNPLALVFPSEDGTPLYSGNVRRRHFAPALKALGLSGIRPHDFRRISDRKLETGHARESQPPGSRNRRKGPAGDGTSPHAEVEGHATIGRAGDASEIFGVVAGPKRGGCQRGQSSPSAGSGQARRSRLCEQLPAGRPAASEMNTSPVCVRTRTGRLKRGS